MNNPKNQLSMLKQSLREFGWTHSIQITSDNMVVAGHARLRAALVLDLFSGSGTTLIASHQFNRVCYGVELNPRYCDVIIQRYVNLTGNRELKQKGEIYTWEEKRAV